MVVSEILDTNMIFVRPKRQKTPIAAQIKYATARGHLSRFICKQHVLVRGHCGKKGPGRSCALKIPGKE